MSTDITSQITTELSSLAPEIQLRVLEYVRSLKGSPKGTPGVELMEFAGSISESDAKLMITAIEEGCGQVNLDEW